MLGAGEVITLVGRPFVSAIIFEKDRKGRHVSRPPFVSGSTSKAVGEKRLVAVKMGLTRRVAGVLNGPSNRQDAATAFPAIGSIICCSIAMPPGNGKTQRGQIVP